MRVALLAILALVAVLVCHVHAAELAIESHLSPREQQQLLEAETDPAQAARREQLLQDWGAFIMMSLHAQKVTPQFSPASLHDHHSYVHVLT